MTNAIRLSREPTEKERSFVGRLLAYSVLQDPTRDEDTHADIVANSLVKSSPDLIELARTNRLSAYNIALERVFAAMREPRAYIESEGDAQAHRDVLAAQAADPSLDYIQALNRVMEQRRAGGPTS